MVLGEIRKSKSVSIRKALLDQLQSGDYARGHRIPSERALAQRLGVSFMTVRKAIRQLVDEGFLVRTIGQGTFVRQDIPEGQMRRQVGILCPAWAAPEVTAFTMHLMKIAESHHRQARVFHFRSWNERLVHDVIDQCDALMVCPSGEPLVPETTAIFRQGRKPIVFVGEPMYVMGFDSVMGEPEAEIDLAIDHLRELGHRRIALVWQAQGKREEISAATTRSVSRWAQRMKSVVGTEALNGLELTVDVPQFEWPHQAIYDRIVERYRGSSEPFTAVISPLAWVQGAMGALHDLGVRVPEDVSVATIGDREEARFQRPMFTNVYVSYEEHVRLAWELIERRWENPELPPTHMVVKPKLIIGKTTGRNVNC